MLTDWHRGAEIKVFEWVQTDTWQLSFLLPFFSPKHPDCNTSPAPLVLFKGKYTYAVCEKEDVSAIVCRISLCNTPITESLKPSIISSVLQTIGNGRLEKASLERECTSNHLHRNHIGKGVQSQGIQSLRLARITARLEGKWSHLTFPIPHCSSPWVH